MISVIISAYNNDKFILEALKSVESSAKQIDHEILLGIDNCEITMNYLKSNFNNLPKKLKVFFFPKVGTYVIRNTLAKISEFENIIFFDSDDILHENTISESLSVLNNFEVVRYKYRLFNNTFESEKKDQYVKGEVYHTGCFGIKKKTFLSLNGFEPWICAADGEFHWRLKSNQHSSNNTSDIGLYYRRHGDNLTMAGNTGMNSPLRKKYHLIKNQKIKNNQSGKLDILNVSDFLQITKENISNYYPIFQKLNIKPNSFDNLQDRSKIEDELSKKQNIILPSKIVEKTNKQIDYNKINEIFEKNKSSYLNQKKQNLVSDNKSTKNTDLLTKLTTKNKRKFI